MGRPASTCEAPGLIVKAPDEEGDMACEEVLEHPKQWR